MKKFVLLFISVLLLTLCSCKTETTEFSAVVLGSYTDYISVVTVDPAVDFLYADIKINVATLRFTPTAGCSIRVFAEKIQEGNNAYTVVPQKIEKIDVQVNAVSVTEAEKLIDGENAFIVDARNSAEFKYGHIKNAVNITTEKLKAKLKLLPKDLSTPIICCSKKTDGRSEEMAQLLISLGYTRVYNMGDLENWQGQLET